MAKKNYYIFILFTALLSQAEGQVSSTLSADTILSLMNKVAHWQMKEWAEGHIIKLPKTSWENGAFYTGLVALKLIDRRPEYDSFLFDIGEECRWDLGPFRFFADDYCVAQMYTTMYIEHRQPKMIEKWKALADSIVAKPFIEPLNVMPNINHREWAWCDALFMGPPGLALLSTAIHDSKYLTKADSLWWKTSDYLYSKEDSLFYRDSRFFVRREANGKKVFWSRGNGWVLAGLARMLENFPADFQNRNKYIQQFRQMAKKIASLQQFDGSWHSSLYDPKAFDVKESSATAFFCYGIAWGIHYGLLPYKEYMPVVLKAWDALVASIHPDGKLGFVQPIGDKPVKTGYDDTNVYGVGALLLAGSELYKIQKKL